MKRTFCMAVLSALLTIPLFAQRDRTLFSNSSRNGFFVSPLVEYSELDRDITTSVGGGLGFVSGDFFFGAYGLGVTSYDNLFNGDLRDMSMGHGGFWLGLVYPQEEAFHMFSSVKLGWGGVDLNFDDGDLNYRDAFFAMTPEVGVELNVFSWFRVAATAGYRWMSGLDESKGYRDEDFESFTGTLTFRVGGFGRGARCRW